MEQDNLRNVLVSLINKENKLYQEKDYSSNVNTLEKMVLRLKSRNKDYSRYPFQKYMSGSYLMSLFDDSVDNPFIINSEMAERARLETIDEMNHLKKAHRLYVWLYENISYGVKKRINGYKNSQETFNDLEGVCGEMSFLYITLARACGIRSSYVSVKVDCFGNEVSHACAVAHCSRDVFVDIAYKTFDISHHKYQIIKDRDVLVRYLLWRNQDLVRE